MTCEMTGCGELATMYAGFKGADAWAGRVCTAHAYGMGGWMERLNSTPPTIASDDVDYPGDISTCQSCGTYADAIVHKSCPSCGGYLG